MAQSSRNQSKIKNFTQNQLIYNSKQKNNYANNSSYKGKTLKYEENHLEEANPNLEKFFVNTNSKQRHFFTLPVITSTISDKETSIIQEMVSTWNDIFAYSLKPIKEYANQKNSTKLIKILAKFFEGSLERWKDYALKVNSSKFLMGEKETKNSFKAVFAWLIKEETVEAILAGEYGVGDRIIDEDNLVQNIETQEQEIIEKVNKKFTEAVSANIDKNREEKEFWKLLESKNDDNYGVKQRMREWGIYTASSLLYGGPQYKFLKNTLFEMFLTKKLYNTEKFEIQKKVEIY